MPRDKPSERYNVTPCSGGQHAGFPSLHRRGDTEEARQARRDRVPREEDDHSILQRLLLQLVQVPDGPMALTRKQIGGMAGRYKGGNALLSERVCSRIHGGFEQGVG